MAKLLNIETSSHVCSVGYAIDGKIITLKENNKDKTHARLLTSFIEEILNEQQITIDDLNAIAVSKGPGSYTGLRIGVSAAKGLCYGSSLPLISVCSLQSMAQGIITNNKIFKINPTDHVLLCPLIDARRMEVYSCFYNLQAQPLNEIRAIIIDENTFQKELNSNTIVFFGSGAEKCKRILEHKNAIFIDNFECSARFMSLLSEKAFVENRIEDTAYFEPFYLKDFVPTIPKKNIIQKMIQ